MARVSVATVSVHRLSSPPNPPISFSALESCTTHLAAFASSSCGHHNKNRHLRWRRHQTTTGARLGFTKEGCELMRHRVVRGYRVQSLISDVDHSHQVSSATDTSTLVVARPISSSLGSVGHLYTSSETQAHKETSHASRVVDWLVPLTPPGCCQFEGGSCGVHASACQMRCGRSLQTIPPPKHCSIYYILQTPRTNALDM